MQEKALGKKPRAFLCLKQEKYTLQSDLSQGDVTKPMERGETLFFKLGNYSLKWLEFGE